MTSVAFIFLLKDLTTVEAYLVIYSLIILQLQSVVRTANSAEVFIKKELKLNK